MTNKLGFISKKYESGKSGPSTISTMRGDPGGTSYGEYQLAMNTGTLMYFIKSKNFMHQFEGMDPGSKAFNERWIEMSKDPKFVEAQYSYIYDNNYSPVRDYADHLGWIDTRAVNEMLFSIGVQHGRFKKILNAVPAPFDNEAKLISNTMYARKEYVSGLNLPKSIKQALLMRYKNETEDLLKLL